MTIFNILQYSCTVFSYMTVQYLLIWLYNILIHGCIIFSYMLYFGLTTFQLSLGWVSFAILYFRLTCIYSYVASFIFQVDSYSAFFDNGDFTSTTLRSILQEHGIDTLFIAGLATDYCVYWTAQDALELGLNTSL